MNNNSELSGAITGGYINIFYNDLTNSFGGKKVLGTDAIKVLSVAITKSNGPLSTSVGLNLNGVVDYSASSINNIDVSNSFVEDFFYFTESKSLGGITSNSSKLQRVVNAKLSESAIA